MRRIVYRAKEILIRALLLASFPFLSGCGGQPWFAQWFKESNSLDTGGERISVTMFRMPQDVESYANAHIPKSDNFLPYWHSIENPARPLVLPVVAAAAVTAAVGFAVDLIQSDLQKEAGLFQAQFSGAANEPDFWTYFTDPHSANRGYQPAYRGFAITRNTNTHTGKSPGSDAFNLICLMAPVGNGGVFAVQPIYFKTCSTKAKVYLFGAKTIESKVTLSITGTWIDSKDSSFHSEATGSAVLDVGGYDIRSCPWMSNQDLTKPTPANTDASGDLGSIGFVSGPPQPPLPSDSTQKPALTGGAFNITALITETDQSEAQVALQNVATFLQNNKSTIVQIVNGATGGQTTQSSAAH
jgi:hypothetical protein